MNRDDLRTIQSASLRELITATERDRAVNRIVPAQRVRTLLDAIRGHADEIDRRPSRARVRVDATLCLVLALGSGIGIGALVFTAILP